MSGAEPSSAGAAVKRAIAVVLTGTLIGVAIAGNAAARPRPELPPQDVWLPPAGVLALENVTVIDGTDAPPQPGTTVLIRGDRIAAIGPVGTVDVPPGARVIDGTGRFLIPGLWDMHVHLLGEPYAGINPRLLVSYGVTGARVLEPYAVRDPELLGPRSVTGGRFVNGPGSVARRMIIVSNASEGRLAVDSALLGGADFVKVYNLVPRDAYFALTEEARRRGVTVMGHVPFAITAWEAASAGHATNEHLTSIIVGCSRDAAALHAEIEAMLAAPADSRSIPRTMVDIEERATRTYDAGTCAALGRHMAATGAAITPTLVQARRHALASYASDLHPEDFIRVEPEWIPQFDEQVRYFQGLPIEKRMLHDSVYRGRLRIVRQLAEQGVEVLVGTDMMARFILPGRSVHEEMELLVEAGLTGAAALRAATSAPARRLGLADSLGTIATGKIADLVLLDDDPLVDISHTRRIGAVVLRGRYLHRDRLNILRDEAETLARTVTPPDTWIHHATGLLKNLWSGRDQ